MEAQRNVCVELAQRADRRRGLPLAAREYLRERERFRAVWEIGDRDGRCGAEALPHRRRDADDGQPRRGVVRPVARRQANAPAEGILVREERLGEEAVDDGRLVAGGSVAIGERAAAPEAEVQPLEVVGRDGDDARRRRRAIAGEGAAVDRELASRRGDERRSARPGGGQTGCGRGDPIVERPKEGKAPFRRRVARFGQGELDRGHAGGVENAVGVREGQQTARHQPGPGQQHQGQRHLGRHQPRRPAALRTAAGRAAYPAGRDIPDIGARRVEGGRETQQRHDRQAGQGEESRHAAVDGEVQPEGGVQRRDAQREQAGRERCEPEPERARESRDDRALGEQLPHDASPRRAQRNPHADLARAAGGAREQQVGRIGARNEENEHRRRHHRVQRRLKLRVEVLVERGESRSQPRVRVGMRLRQAGRHRVEVRLRPGEAHAGREATEGSKGPPVTLVLREAGGERQRLPQVGPERELEALGHHPDDGRRYVVQPDDAAEHLRVRAVAGRPDAVSQQHHGRRGRPIVVRAKVAADHGPDAEQAECVRGDARAEELLRAHPRVGDVHRRLAVRRDAPEAPGRVAPVQRVEVRDPLFAPGLVAHRQRRDAVLVVDGEAPEQQAVVGGERGAREAKAQPEGEHRPRRHPGLLHQQARREPQVLPCLFEPPRPARVAARLLDLVEAPEREARPSTRLVLGQAGPDVTGHLPLDVIAQLAVELPFEPVSLAATGPPAHRMPPSASAGRAGLSVCSCSAGRSKVPGGGGVPGSFIA